MEGRTLGRTRLRVLAVDDNVDVADGLAALIGMWGHTVQIAHDGVSALDVASTFAPDVVVLDLRLPGIDGLEVARRLTARSPAPSLLIALTGFGEPADIARARAAGFHHHFVKPIDLDVLRVLLHEWSHERPISR